MAAVIAIFANKKCLIPDETELSILFLFIFIEIADSFDYLTGN